MESSGFWACLSGSVAGLALGCSLWMPTGAHWLVPATVGLGSLGVAVAAGLGRAKVPSQAYPTAAALGCVASGGLWLIQHEPQYWHFGAYACALAFFHTSEFLLTAIYHPDTLSFDSFLINHSWSYGLAAVASWIEYGLEATFLPQLKISYISHLGLVLVTGGEFLRKLAMITAAQSFTHIVAVEKKEQHQLVTNGIYRLCRHPSYAGWFWWAMGTQLMLVNPICLLGYAFATHKFFADRVEFEERYLLHFFGPAYDQYQDQVPRTGVPLVKGFRASENLRKYWRSQATVAS